MIFKWINKNKLIFSIVSVLTFIFFIILIPLILNKIYYTKAICNFFVVGYSVDYILGYYGNILTFIGTVSLGIITVYQNHVSQQKTEKISELQIQLAERNAELAEKSYKKQLEDTNIKLLPRFELINQRISGGYSNLTAKLKNVSSSAISELKSVSFEVINSENNILLKSEKVNIKTSFLLSGTETEIEFNNKEMNSSDQFNEFGNSRKVPWKNIKIEWRFQCNDEHSRTHFFKATVIIEDCDIFIPNIWNVEKLDNN